jgi:hypothetical protein
MRFRVQSDGVKRARIGRGLLLGAGLLSAGAALGQDGFLVEPWRGTPSFFAVVPVPEPENSATNAKDVFVARSGERPTRSLRRPWLVEKAELSAPGFRHSNPPKAAPELFDPWANAPSESPSTAKPRETVSEKELLVDPWADDARSKTAEVSGAEPWLEDPTP